MVLTRGVLYVLWVRLPGGFLVFVGNPSFAPIAVTHVAGQGAVLWVGAGGAVVG